MPVEFNNNDSYELEQDYLSQTEDNLDVELNDDNIYYSHEEIEETIPGLSTEELRDPNKIVVTIADSSTPIVVLFGPPASGKTMTLVRLTRFLKNEGYVVGPIRTFRPAADSNYRNICNNFDSIINSNDAASSTDHVSFMLVEVIKNGRVLCQILEAPGEHYFKPDDPTSQFPVYVNKIINCTNRKIWAIMLEPDWMDHSDRLNYVNKIGLLKREMRPRDKTIFVFNKIDKTNYVRSLGNVNEQEAIKKVGQLYPGIYAPFENQNPITRLWKKYNCEFIPFQTGNYSRTVTGGLTYVEGPREYCAKLWNYICDALKG